MDCDLQDNPKYISCLIQEWQKGNDIVYTVKQKRAHTIIKNLYARLFNYVFNFLVNHKDIESRNNIGSFSLISRKVVESFLQFNDYQFHYLMVLRWLGYKKSHIIIEHDKRFEGESSYSTKKLLNHALIAITYQSDKLLKFSIYFGFTFSIISLVLATVLIINYFISGPQPGWTSLIVVILFATGLILLSIGVLGMYIGKMFEQVKNRPQYIIDKSVNL
jgi:dolichol-phosphate mannosyltransferase